MEHFREISPESIGNAQKLIGKDWMLISAGDINSFNTMTASWGAMGVLWNKPVCIGYIRPTRYTFLFAEEADVMTFCFFGEEMRPALKFCGSHSGKDVDKIKETNLTPIPVMNGKGVIYEEATLALVCRKLYTSDIKEDGFIDPSLLSNYPARDFHRQYICEILSAYEKI